MAGFALTVAPPWNEGIDLVAAQLIRSGKTPYLDFFYQHPPLYAYVNAGWMAVFGDNWKSVQALPAFLTGGCVALVAGYTYLRTEHPEWRTATAVSAALLVGFHPLVVRFGAVAQPYAFCLFLLVLAFRLVTAAASQKNCFLPAWAGLCAGATLVSWLMAAPACPILIAWMISHNRVGSRWHKGTALLGGMTAGVAPLIWLAVRAPRQVWFDVFEYHVFYRRPEHLPWFYFKHDMNVLVSWVKSPQALLLAGLAGLGMLYATRGEPLEHRAEYRLCWWLTIGLAVPAAVASPTFAGYFILMIPFLGLLAARGFCATGFNWWSSRNHAWAVLLLGGLMAAGLANWLEQYRAIFHFSWRRYEQIAAHVNRVTAPDHSVYAIPEIYFMARRTPPPGLENPFSSYLPAAVAAAQRLVPASQIDKWLAAGRFDTVVIADRAKADRLGLPRRYAKRDKLDGFDIFWQRLAGSTDLTILPED